ncbi:MAG: phosphate ABC transporter permease PstA [Acidimicrobiales bacterium]
MSDTLVGLPPDPILERRQEIQRRASQTIGRRTLVSNIFMGLLIGAFALALVPLGSVIWALLAKGLPSISWGFLHRLPQQPSLIAQNAIGGVGNAIEGTLVLDICAGLVAVPIAVIVGLYLSETSSRIGNFLRAIVEIMTGLPSILLGVFAYEYVVVPMKSFSGLAGIVALAVLMVPVIAKASELAFRGVPRTLKEAGLALGARSSRVSRGVILPVAMPGVLTGVLLALARAVGETAPILLVVGPSVSNTWNWNPLHPMSALPLLTYGYSGSQYPSQRAAAWGVALTLVFLVMVFSFASRLVSARMRRERRS